MPVTIATKEGHYSLFGWVKEQKGALQFADFPAAEHVAKDKKLKGYTILPVVQKPDPGHEPHDIFGFKGRKYG